MKFRKRSVLAAIAVAASSLAFGHSIMFDDYFKFDDSNEGEPVLRALSDGARFAPTVCSNGSADGYPCDKIDLMAFLPKADMGGGNANLNDIWGWTDPLTGQEIAIVGRTNGTSFVDVTDAANPEFLGFLPTRDGTDSWRDMKVFNDHVFIVADLTRNRNHGLQVFDLNSLRDLPPGGVTLQEDAGFDGFGNAHNIAINEDSGYAYAVGSNQCSGGLYMINISNPLNPSFAGCFSADGYTHDAQCVIYNGPDAIYNGNEICVGYNEDTLTIVDVTNKNNPRQISRTGYTGSRYTHQGWFLDGDHRYLILNDEQDESGRGINTTSYIWDVSDLDNPVEIGRYVGPTRAIDHNLYTRDGLVIEANYRAGLRILASDDIAQGTLREVAFFDTIPNSNSAQFSGLWSSYVEFASGNIIASDIGNGLFVLRPDYDAINGNPPTPTPTPLPPGDCVYASTFEADAGGWQNAASSSCSTGTFVRGTPTQTNDGLILQPAGAAEGANAWFTATNSAVGSNDVDGGTCTSVSPTIDASALANAEISFSYFAGQRDGGDDANDSIVFEVLNNGNVVDRIVDIGDVQVAASWTQASAVVANPGNIQIRVSATDASGPGDIIEAGIDNVLVCPGDVVPPTPTPIPTPTVTPTPCAVEEGFEANGGGWSNSTSASCSTGAFVRGTPTEVVNGGTLTQPNGAAEGSNALFTAVNSAAGADDVDGGTCIASSPTYSVDTNSTLSIQYFHGQRDAGDDAGDGFELSISTDGGNTFNALVSEGDIQSTGSWRTTTANINAGSNVVVQVQCSDAPGAGDLVECGVDALSICPR